MKLKDCNLSLFAKQKLALELENGDVIFTPDVFPVVRAVKKIDKTQKNIHGKTIVKTGNQIASPWFSENDKVWVFKSKQLAEKAFNEVIKPMQEEIALLKSLSQESLIKLAKEVQWAKSDEKEAILFDDSSQNFGYDSKKERLNKLVKLAQQKGIEVPECVLEAIS